MRQRKREERKGRKEIFWREERKGKDVEREEERMSGEERNLKDDRKDSEEILWREER